VNLILVGATDRQLEDTVRDCGLTPTILPGSELAALAQPSAKPADVVIIDLREQTMPVALPLLKRHHPLTGIVIVAARLDPALLLEAMRSGVNEFVCEPVTSVELEAAIKRVMAQRTVTQTPGQIFAFVGAKGGVGTTTVAVNVATALAKTQGKEETLLVDLHVTNGDAALFLGQEPRFSIVDALENTHRLDEVFFRGLLTKTKAGVSLLASSDRVMVTPVDVRRVCTLLEFATQHFKYIVLDVPRSDAAILDALEGVTRIVVVANQELPTVRSASRMAATLRQRYGKDKLTVVVSRVDRVAEIRQEDVAKAVGSPVGHSFPSDYRRALEALNKGRPLTLENHNELSGSLVKFAESLAGVHKPQAERLPARFGLFGSRRGAAQESR
jgi:pilus assembly protein CpaE